ncbi:MAG: phosphodiester glycosidase family protein, partial [Clostridia bacterium]|nr:phosphodiester glycosidase family protein [Clostridia bacterium]
TSENTSENTSEYTSVDTSETSSEEPEIDISEDIVTIESAGERFKDKFTDGEVISTENSYISEFVNVSLKEITYEGKLYFVQDIYIKKIESLSVGFAGLEFGKKYNDYVLNMVEDYNQNGYNVVGAVNGDYCGLDGKGVIIRNGVLYGTGVAQYTICVLYKNGVMKIIDKNSFDAQAELNKGAWHAWDFAPSFLDINGAPLSTFTDRKSISRSNPRTVIGYFEPGHYCFVTAGGRAKGSSYGVSFKQISNFMSSLGCKIAYNLDGGKSAVMVFGNRIINEEYQGTGRKISDIVFINDIKNEQ